MPKFRTTTMQYHRHIVSAALALIAWTIPANAAAPERTARSPSPLCPSRPGSRSRHATTTGATGSAAILLGVARERGLGWQTVLRATNFGRATTVRIDSPALALHSDATNVAVSASLDGGPFRAVPGGSAPTARPRADDEAAVAFLTGLYGKRELRLAVVAAVRPIRADLRRRRGRAWPRPCGGTGRMAAPALSEALH